MKSSSAILLVAILIVQFGCSSKHHKVEQAIIAAIENARQGNPMPIEINIQTITGKAVSNICVQTPYINQEQFEKRCGQKTEWYWTVDDSRYVLWIFFSDQAISTVEIDRWKQMSFGEKSVRSSIKPSVFIRNKDSSIIFYLQE